MTKYHDQGLIKAIAIEIKRQTPKHIEVNKRYCLKKLSEETDKKKLAYYSDIAKRNGVGKVSVRYTIEVLIRIQNELLERKSIALNSLRDTKNRDNKKSEIRIARLTEQHKVYMETFELVQKYLRFLLVEDGRGGI